MAGDSIKVISNDSTNFIEKIKYRNGIFYQKIIKKINDDEFNVILNYDFEEGLLTEVLDMGKCILVYRIRDSSLLSGIESWDMIPEHLEMYLKLKVKTEKSILEGYFLKTTSVGRSNETILLEIFKGDKYLYTSNASGTFLSGSEKLHKSFRKKLGKYSRKKGREFKRNQ